MRKIALRTARLLRLPLIAAATAVIAYLAWMGLVGSLAAFEHPNLSPIDDRAFGDRILVVAPHPDDETLGAGGLVRRSLEAGKRVLVVVTTSGDGFKRIVGAYKTSTGTQSPYVHLGEVRTAEARAALGSLGLPASDVVFLGYPDGSMASLWKGPWDEPSAGVNGRTAVPYAFAYRPGAAYEASSVVADLSSIVTSFSPTSVVYPDAEDSNADHWAVNAFTELTLDRVAPAARRYTYLVHRGHFPFPWSYVPRDWIVPPRTLARLGSSRWYSSPLSGDEEAAKEAALMKYGSQQAAIEPFLAAFVRRNELFGSWGRSCVATAGAVSSLDASSMPGVVVCDPGADTLLRFVDGAGDLRDVAVLRDGGRVWLGVETRSTPAPAMTYRISLRLLRADPMPARLEIDVHRRSASAVDAGEGSLLPKDLETRVIGKRLWVGVPASILAGARRGILSAECSQGRTIIDRTACRGFDVP